MKARTLTAVLILFCWGHLGEMMVRGQNGVTPVLSIVLTDSRTVALSWSNEAPGYVLQEVESLSMATPWRGILQAPLLRSNELAVTQTLSNAAAGARFYRLVAKGAPAGLDYVLARQNSDGTFGSPSRTLFRDTAGA